jgi:hypothetical protein
LACTITRPPPRRKFHPSTAPIDPTSVARSVEIWDDCGHIQTNSDKFNREIGITIAPFTGVIEAAFSIQKKPSRAWRWLIRHP